MQIIGFVLTKILAEKSREFKKLNPNTNIEFTELVKEDVPILEGKPAIKISFRYTVSHDEEKKKDVSNQILFEGDIVLAVSDQEVADIPKAWKKKALPDEFKLFLFNLILRKCSIKALQLAEDVNLPPHIPLPALRPENKKVE